MKEVIKNLLTAIRNLVAPKGAALINREIGRFEAVSSRLKAGIEGSKKEIRDNEKKISDLQSENLDKQRDIKRASTIISKISDLLVAV